VVDVTSFPFTVHPENSNLHKLTSPPKGLAVMMAIKASANFAIELMQINGVEWGNFC